jgi:hypothetical protein
MASQKASLMVSALASERHLVKELASERRLAKALAMQIHLAKALELASESHLGMAMVMESQSKELGHLVPEPMAQKKYKLLVLV